LKNKKPAFDFVTFDEAKRLVAAANGEWQTMILVALRTGMRHGRATRASLGRCRSGRGRTSCGSGSVSGSVFAPCATPAEDVIAYCKDKLAAYKYPALDRVRDALPKGPTGKILKRELR
jgi:acyl-CoA synthetase (AMP-forming)/AMP-acid ligase II